MKKYVPFFISFTALLIGAHYIVYLLLSSAWPNLLIQNIWLRLFLFVGVGASFILTSIGVSKYKNKFLEFLYTITALWLGYFFYLFFGAFVWGILMHFFDDVSLLARISVSVGVLIASYGVVNARFIHIKKYEVEIKNLPEVWKDKKIVVLSDLHFGAVNGIHYAKRIVHKIKKQNPDIIFIVGDFFDGVKVDEQTLAEIFAELKPKDGVFFVMGNHDEFTDNSEKEKLLKHAGMIVLDNEKHHLDGVDILGVDYKNTVKEKDLEQELKRLVIDPLTPSILLRHVPTHMDIAANSKVDLVLSGHTHRGQMYPSNYVASRVHKGFGYGLKKSGETQVIVSSGIGTWGPPIRVGSHSELLILKLI